MASDTELPNKSETLGSPKAPRRTRTHARLWIWPTIGIIVAAAAVAIQFDSSDSPAIGTAEGSLAIRPTAVPTTAVPTTAVPTTTQLQLPYFLDRPFNPGAPVIPSITTLAPTTTVDSAPPAPPAVTDPSPLILVPVPATTLPPAPATTSPASPAASVPVLSSMSWTPLGNSVVNANTIVVDATGPWPDTTRTSRAGTSPHGPAAPGDTFRGSVVMSPGVTFRAELRFFRARRILTTITTAPLITSDGTTASTIEATAPANTDGVILRVFMDNVDYGESYQILAANLDLINTTPATAAPTPATPTPAPTTTVAPAPAPIAVAPSTGGGYASLAMTGPSKALTTTSSSITVTTDGTIIDGYDITGAIIVRANNVTIRDTRIRTTSPYGIDTDSTVTGLVIDHVSIEGLANTCSAGIDPAGSWTLRYSNISGCIDGIKVHSNQLVEWNYVYNLRTGNLPNGGLAHNDAMQSTSGNNVIVRHNNLNANWQAGANSSLMMGTNFGTLSNYVFDSNRFNGGQFTVFFRDKGYGTPTNITITNNTWARNWHYGSRSFDGTTVTLGTGNQYENGTPL